MSSRSAARWHAVTAGDERGRDIDRRAKALGIFTVREFERMTETVSRRVPRASIQKAIDGDASNGILDRLEAALDLLEEETRDERDVQESGTIRFSLHNVYGIGEVVAEGAPEDRDALVEALTKLIRDIREEGSGGRGAGSETGNT